MANSLESLTKRRAELAKQLDDVDQQIAELKEEKQRDLLAQLAELGWKAPTAARGPRASTPASTTKRAKKDAPCSVCNFKTSPPHDARSHRQQNPKAPFTKSELEAKGMSKVA